jgi:hypothetical protein
MKFNLGPFRSLLEIKLKNIFNGPSITHKDNHFAPQKNIKIEWKIKRLKF